MSRRASLRLRLPEDGNGDLSRPLLQRRVESAAVLDAARVQRAAGDPVPMDEVDKLHAALCPGPGGAEPRVRHLVDAFRKARFRTDVLDLRRQLRAEWEAVAEFRLHLGRVLGVVDGLVGPVADVWNDELDQRPLPRDEFRALYAACYADEPTALPRAHQFAKVSLTRLRDALFGEPPLRVLATIEARAHAVFDTVFAHVDINTTEGIIDARITVEELISALELLSGDIPVLRMLFPTPTAPEASDPGASPGQVINEFFEKHGALQTGIEKPLFHQLFLELAAPERAAAEASGLTLSFALFLRDRALQLMLASQSERQGNTPPFRTKLFLWLLGVAFFFPFMGLRTARSLRAIVVRHFDVHEDRMRAGAMFRRALHQARLHPLTSTLVVYVAVTVVWALVYVPPVWWAAVCLSHVSTDSECCLSAFEALYPSVIIMTFTIALGVYRASHSEVDPEEFRVVRLRGRLRALRCVLRVFDSGADEEMPAAALLPYLRPPPNVSMVGHVLQSGALSQVPRGERVLQVVLISSHALVVALAPGVLRALPNRLANTSSCGALISLSSSGSVDLGTLFGLAYVPLALLVTTALGLVLLRLFVQFAAIGRAIDRLTALLAPVFWQSEDRRLPGFLDIADPRNVAAWSKLRQFLLVASARQMEALQILLAAVVLLVFVFAVALISIMYAHVDAQATWDAVVVTVGLTACLSFLVGPLLRCFATAVHVNQLLESHPKLLRRLRYRHREAAALCTDDADAAAATSRRAAVELLSDLTELITFADTPVQVLGVRLTPALTQTFVAGVATTAASSVYTYLST